MPIVLQLQEVKRNKTERPRKCPHCEGETFQRWGIERRAIVTNDLAMYRTLSEQLDLGHQICHFHVRRWVGRACWGLGNRLPEDWLWLLDRIKVIMEDLPQDGGKQLLDLYRQLPVHRQWGQERTPLDELRHLLIRLSENWERYTTFFHDPGLPWTNNRIACYALGNWANLAI